MRGKEDTFIADLEKSVKNGSAAISNSVLDIFQKLLMESTNTYFQAYFERDFGEINQILQEQRSLRKTLTNEMRNYPDQSIVVYAKLVQTYNIFSKLVQNEEQRKDFAENISFVERRYERAREVLVYLYKHMHVQHKELKDNLGIPPSTLSDLLNVLREIECVERIESGRCSFYNLTNAGRKYLRQVHPDIDQEWDIDRDSFGVEVREIVKEKKRAENIISRTDYYKIRFSLDKVEKKWVNEVEAYANIG